MDNKRKIVNTTITRNTAKLSAGTDNIYETVAILSKRANQIAAEEKRDLHEQIDGIKNRLDTLDDMFENREQVDIVRRFEVRPKPVLEATEEYLDGELAFRNPNKEDQSQRRYEDLEASVISGNEEPKA